MSRGATVVGTVAVFPAMNAYASGCCCYWLFLLLPERAGGEALDIQVEGAPQHGHHFRTIHGTSAMIPLDPQTQERSCVCHELVLALPCMYWNVDRIGGLPFTCLSLAELFQTPMLCRSLASVHDNPP